MTDEDHMRKLFIGHVANLLDEIELPAQYSREGIIRRVKDATGSHSMIWELWDTDAIEMLRDELTDTTPT